MEEKARQPINPCFSRGRRSRAALESKAGGRHGWRVENGLRGLLRLGLLACRLLVQCNQRGANRVSRVLCVAVRQVRDGCLGASGLFCDLHLG